MLVDYDKDFLKALICPDAITMSLNCSCNTEQLQELGNIYIYLKIRIYLLHVKLNNTVNFTMTLCIFDLAINFPKGCVITL